MTPESSPHPQREGAQADGDWIRPRRRLTGRSVASVAAVALALAAAIVWEAVSGDAPAVDADSAKLADFDADSASGPETTATESAGTVQEDEPSSDATQTSDATPSESTSEDAVGTATAGPGTGVYRARQEASGLCMTWGDEPDGDGRSVMALGDCASTEPELTWVEDGGRYAVEMAFEDWTPCMTVDNGGTEDGMLVGFDGCDGLDAQTWELAPAGGGYLLRTAASDSLCLSVLKSASAESGDAVALQDCDAGDAKQRWTLL